MPSYRSQKRSAGLLLYRTSSGALEVFLVHPGGPFWTHKDLGAWTLPKGEYLPDEDPLEAARREFREETGFPPPYSEDGRFLALGTVRQLSGKLVSGWAFEGDCDPAQLVSNTCTIEWPPRSGKQLEVPEVDRGAWFPLAEARQKILAAQIPFLDTLARLLAP
jgi:predicted NUDIX family NTP pyrophosphohydrolase